MWKWLMLLAVGYALYRLVMHDRRKKADDATRDKERKAAAGELVRDPVCGAYVEPSSSVTVRRGDEVRCFCSYECRDKYLSSIGALPVKEDQGD